MTSTSTLEATRSRLARLLDGPAHSWRTQPRYTGHVADGYYLDGQGALCYREAEPPDPPPGPVVIRGIAAAGKFPADTEIDVVRRELAKLPADVVDELDGWTVEVVSGSDARAHPDTGLSLVRVHCGGWCSWRRKLIAVAAAGAQITTLHEAGHAVDANQGTFGRFSSAACWKDTIGGTDEGGERFAESFGLYWHGQAARAALTGDVRNFMQALCRG